MEERFESYLDQIDGLLKDGLNSFHVVPGDGAISMLSIHYISIILSEFSTKSSLSSFQNLREYIVHLLTDSFVEIVKVATIENDGVVLTRKAVVDYILSYIGALPFSDSILVYHTVSNALLYFRSTAKRNRKLYLNILSIANTSLLPNREERD